MLLESRRSSHSEASSSAAPLDAPRDSSQLGLEATLEAAVGAGIQAGMDIINAGVGAGESAFQTLLSTNPDPDHVTHVSTNTAAEEARQDGDTFSPASSHSPSEDSNKENNAELVSMVHANTPGRQGSEVQLKVFGSGGDRLGSGEVRLSVTEEEEQEDTEAQVLLSQQQQKSDEPEPVRSKVSLNFYAQMLTHFVALRCTYSSCDVHTGICMHILAFPHRRFAAGIFLLTAICTAWGCRCLYACRFLYVCNALSCSANQQYMAPCVQLQLHKVRLSARKHDFSIAL